MQQILQIEFWLSENLHSELWFLNTYLLNWLSLTSTDKLLLQMINKWRDKTDENAKLQCAHIRILNRWVYLMNKKMSKDCKFLSHAHIDYLIDFDATNIYHVWISHLKWIFHVRNIQIDKTITFDSDNSHFDSLIIIEIEDLICIIEISDLSDIVQTDFNY